MELQGIQASMAANSAMRVQSRTLTDEQKTKLEEILSKYDPANMTEADKKALMEELRAAKIPPGKETFEAMEKAGFTRPSGPPPGPPPSEADDSATINSTFLELLRQLQSGDLSESKFLDELDALKEEIAKGTSGVIDTTA